MSIVTVDCGECGGTSKFEVSGEYFPQTWTDPAEYPDFETVERGCVTGQEDDHDPEDACTLTDEQVNDRAWDTWWAEAGPSYRGRR